VRKKSPVALDRIFKAEIIFRSVASYSYFVAIAIVVTVNRLYVDMCVSECEDE